MIPIDGGDRNPAKFEKECGTANVGGDGVRHDLLAPRVFTVVTATIMRFKVVYPFVWP